MKQSAIKPRLAQETDSVAMKGQRLVKTKEDEVLELSNRRLELETKRQIYEKVRTRMAELTIKTDNAASFCPELNPDVIVISDDQSLLFEPQNSRAFELLSQRCGSGSEIFAAKERIRVHPVGSRKIIGDLTKAGLNVTQECSS